MGRRAPNYRFERQERDRRKAEKKAERLAKRQKSPDDPDGDNDSTVINPPSAEPQQE